MEEVARFDMKRPPIRQRTPLKVLTWFLSFPVVWINRLKSTGKT
jgi:hypothetical protein